MLQESINLVALVATALFAGFAGKYVAQWGMQVYYHLGILGCGRYLVFYDKFRTEPAFDLLSKISDSLPDSYSGYLRLHQENKRSAYRICLSHLLVLLARILLVFGILAGGCFIALGQYYPGWAYLLSMGVALLPAIYGAFHARVRQKRNGKFYRLSVMGVILTKIHKRSVGVPEI